MRCYSRFAGCVTALFWLSLTAQADSTVTYFGQDVASGAAPSSFLESSAARAAFLREIGGFSIEGFESRTTGDGLAIGERAPFIIAANTRLDVDNAIAEAWHFSVGGRYPYAGDNYLLFVGRSAQVSQLVFDFSKPTRAFGFHAVDAGDFAEKLSVELYFEGGATTNLAIPHLSDHTDANASAFFFGVRSDATISRIRLRNDALSDGTPYVAFDEILIGAPAQPLATIPAIPEPPGGILWSIGMLVLLTSMRRLQRRQFAIPATGVQLRRHLRTAQTPHP